MLKSPATITISSISDARSTKFTARRSSAFARRQVAGWLVACRFAISIRWRSPNSIFDEVADAPLALPPARVLRREPELCGLLLAEQVRVQRDLLRPAGASPASAAGSRCPARRAERARPALIDVSPRPTPPGIGIGPSFGTPRARRHRLHAGPLADAAERPGRHLLEADDRGPVDRHELDHLAQVRAPCRSARCCRGRGSRPGRASGSTVRDRARRDRRSAGVHAVVRPRARRRRSLGRAPTSRSRRRASASRTCPPRTATAASSASTRSRRGSSSARARACR